MSAPRINQQNRRALDWMNFFLADVRDGVGPYLAIFLAASHNWSAGDIGIVMGAMGIATGFSQFIAGRITDATSRKRALLATSSLLIGIACPLMALYPSFGVVLLCQIVIGASAAFVVPGISAITLGLSGYRGFSAATGRNQVFNHAGNVVAAIIAGVIGHFIAREMIFWMVALWSVFSLLSILAIRAADINPVLSRGIEVAGDGGRTNGSTASDTAAAVPASNNSLRDLLTNRQVLWFALVVALFHFGNAAMLPLVGQKLSALTANEGAALWMSACIVLAQLVMIPFAHYSGKLSERYSHKWIFLVALVVLPIRGLIFTFADTPALLLAGQLLDGVSAGIFGVMWVLIVANITRNSGFYGTALGLINTAHMIGFFLSQTTSGFVIDYFDSYGAGFLYLSVIAVLAIVVHVLFVNDKRA